MDTPTPHNTDEAFHVHVNEEYGYAKYVNRVADPANPKHEELGAHLDVGPQAVTHEVHYHMDEIDSVVRKQRWGWLTDEQVMNVLVGKRDYIHWGLDIACDKLNVETRGTESTMHLLRNAWQNRLRESMMEGKMLSTPGWMEAAEREAMYNKACRGGSFRVRKELVYELVLDGIVPPVTWETLKPTHTEIASICTNVTQRTDQGQDLAAAWYGELARLDTLPHIPLAKYVYGVITGDVVADNDMAMDHILARLFFGADNFDALVAHFKHAEGIFNRVYLGEQTPEFEDVLMDHEIMARANYYGHDEHDELAHELWMELVEGLYERSTCEEEES